MQMRQFCKRMVPVVLVGLAAVPVVRADVVVTGSYDNSGEGYDTTGLGAGPFDVPADTAAGPSATFNNNTDYGFFAGAGTTVNIAGGQFNGNGFYGVFGDAGVALNISGGQFADANGTKQIAGVFAYQVPVTVSGGVFGSSVPDSNAYGIDLEGTSAKVSGGVFNNNSDDIYDNTGSTLTVTNAQFGGAHGIVADNTSSAIVDGGTFTALVGVAAVDGSTITVQGGAYADTVGDFDAESGGHLDIYGQFTGLSVGQTELLTTNGYFTGQLQANDVSQTFSIDINGGSATLHDVALPEPASLGLLSLAGLGPAAATPGLKQSS